MTEKEISIQITRYINGELNDHEEDLLWELFLSDEKYYRLFETELNLADLYRNKNFSIDNPDNDNNNNNAPERLFSLWTASVAALVLVTSMLYIFSYQSDTQPATYALSEIELTQMLGSNIFRDESPDAAQNDQQINRALTLALSGNTEQATEILDSLASGTLTPAQKALVSYNLGILTYNQSRFEQSLENFRELDGEQPDIIPEYIVENSKWYISNIHLSRGDVNLSVQLLRQIASAEGTHSEKAAELLSMLEE